jgi:hypothetical protein
MIKANRIDVLLTNEGEFRCGDIVMLELGIFPHTYFKTGRIDGIDTLNLILDLSNRYESNVQSFKYSDIWHIKKIGMEADE